MQPLRITPTIKFLLITYLVAFVIQQTGDQFFGTSIGGFFALVPARFVNDFWIWQLFTYAFLHADVMHLFLNCLMLVFIGGELEASWGRRDFLKYYFFGSLFAGVCYLLMQVFVTSGLYSPMVGASGGIYALLIAYGIIFGERQMLFLFLFPMKAKHFIWILAGIEFLTMLYSHSGSRFSAVAHLGGMAGGFAYLWIQAGYRIHQREKRNRGPGRKPKSKFSKMFSGKKKSHLKLVVSQSEEEHDEDGPKTWH